MWESRFSLCTTICSTGRIFKDRIEVSGLITATAISMLRRVFLKTPAFCSSTKLAELSKPLMPSSAALNPIARAISTPLPSGRVARLSFRI